jgi:hypothetical protein
MRVSQALKACVRDRVAFGYGETLGAGAHAPAPIWRALFSKWVVSEGQTGTDGPPSWSVLQWGLRD